METVAMFCDPLVYFSSFGIIYSRLVYFAVLWYIFPVLVCLDQEKSGNLAHNLHNLIDFFEPPFKTLEKNLTQVGLSNLP
jgi:hypothetical protein